MKKLRNIIIYIVCGALVAFFGIVFLLAKNPKVSDCLLYTSRCV